MAARDNFRIAAAGWADEDLPLLYRFATNASTMMHLNEFSTNVNISAFLPAGRPDANYTIFVISEATDSLGSLATVVAVVRVVPYTPPVDEDLSTAAKAMVESLGDDTDAIMQIVASLAASLNMAESSAEEVAAKAEQDRLEQEAQAERLQLQERQAEAEQVQLQREKVISAVDTVEADRLRRDWDQADARLKAEQAAADAAEAERQRLKEERKQAEELKTAQKIRDVLMDALLASPPPAPPEAGANDSACQNGGTAIGMGLGCSCADTAFSGTHCQLSAETAGRVSQTLRQLSARPEQLSAASTDKALKFASSSLNVAALDDGAVEDVANIMSNLLRASAGQFDAEDNHTKGESGNAEEARARASMLATVVDYVASSLASSLVAGEDERSLETDSFGIAVKADLQQSFDGKQLAGGTVIVPAGALKAAASEVVIAKITKWAGPGPLFYTQSSNPSGRNGSTLRSTLTVTFEGDGAEVKVVNLTEPFVMILSMDGNGASSNETASCTHWNPEMQEWVADGLVLNSSTDSIECSFTHLTTFGGFTVPTNNLGSVEDLFSLSVWASNLLGLIVVLSLLCTTLATITWSMSAYIRYVARTRDGGQRMQSSEYAKSMLVVSYNRVTRAKSIAFKLRTKTQCGALLCHLQGDPFATSQRAIIVLVSLLFALVFSLLYFQRPTDPVCLDPLDESTCKAYSCPSCHALHGRAECDDLPSPSDICSTYQGSLSGSAYTGCEVRPLTLCKLPEQYVDPVGNFCVEGTPISVDEFYVNLGTGEHVSSRCVEWVKFDFARMLKEAALATACTMPLLLVLNYLFEELRKPGERAVRGEFVRRTVEVDEEVAKVRIRVLARIARLGAAFRWKITIRCLNYGPRFVPTLCNCCSRTAEPVGPAAARASGEAGSSSRRRSCKRKVRETPCRPRTWANSSFLQLYSHATRECMDQPPASFGPI
jgi:hypothetical protein